MGLSKVALKRDNLHVWGLGDTAPTRHINADLCAKWVGVWQSMQVGTRGDLCVRVFKHKILAWHSVYSQFGSELSILLIVGSEERLWSECEKCEKCFALRSASLWEVFRFGVSVRSVRSVSLWSECEKCFASKARHLCLHIRIRCFVTKCDKGSLQKKINRKKQEIRECLSDLTYIPNWKRRPPEVSEQTLPDTCITSIPHEYMWHKGRWLRHLLCNSLHYRVIVTWL